MKNIGKLLVMLMLVPSAGMIGQTKNTDDVYYAKTDVVKEERPVVVVESNVYQPVYRPVIYPYFGWNFYPNYRYRSGYYAPGYYRGGNHFRGGYNRGGGHYNGGGNNHGGGGRRR